ncbi:MULTISPECIES: nuclear transport factor 2 family protein [unclassified Mycobacterium]|uniref:nuclear transport factor 2 family protein n=1 Tax=unclassified Mycobacterium TaxID=2642494 RepID=UPI0029C9594F|nr:MULTISPECIES: nuclear transport factor 2 family protein [unclassified Mycobacterium]
MDDIEAIKQLKARYCRMLDTKDFDGLRQVFTDDLVVDTTGSGGVVYTGADTFMDFVTTHLAPAVTVHQCHTPELTIASPTTATGIWAMEDRLRFPDGAEISGFGHYHETYEKVAAAWRIKTLRLTRLRQDFISASAG